MIVALHVALIFAIAFAMAKHWQTRDNKLFWLSLAFHLIAGIGVGLVYTYYYSANDTWFFFADAKTLAGIARQDFPAYVRSLFDLSDTMATDLVTQDFRSLVFIKILSVFSFATRDNYWLCTAYVSVLSFAASWFLFRRIKKYFEHSHVAGALAFLFFPSVVFWSSGIEKETLTLSALYFLSGLFLQIKFKQKTFWFHWAIALAAAFVLWALKYYWAGVFFIALIASVAASYWSARQPFVKKYLTVYYIASFILIGVGVSFVHPNFYMNRFLEVVVANHDAFAVLSSDKSLIHFYNLSPTVSSIAINAPWALVSGIFRPFIGEGQGALGLAASLENLLILVLMLSALWSCRERLREPVSILFLATVSYCIVLCIFLALSTPNLGSLSRYRVGFLPFLIFILAYRNPLIDFVAKKLDTQSRN